jgi:hypothetical protein
VFWVPSTRATDFSNACRSMILLCWVLTNSISTPIFLHWRDINFSKEGGWFLQHFFPFVVLCKHVERIIYIHHCRLALQGKYPQLSCPPFDKSRFNMFLVFKSPFAQIMMGYTCKNKSHKGIPLTSYYFFYYSYIILELISKLASMPN